MLFEKLGFDVVKGRSSMEDFIIKPPSDTQINDPLVLEVKSSQKPHLSRDNLRQLDDWVFDLSGEEKARKEGLGGGVDPLAMVTQGLASRKKRHPTPHKGILIFNGPVGIDFSERSSICFDENDREFIEKRNFCIISLDVLVNYMKAFEKDEAIRLIFWESIHKTAGMLNGLQ